ncbi:hypothetical protein FXO38_10909 [Capsicum annuum]|nr:hypothetical protein FXO38_10909 [Capsicum annuum]
MGPIVEAEPRGVGPIARLAPCRPGPGVGDRQCPITGPAHAGLLAMHDHFSHPKPFSTHPDKNRFVEHVDKDNNGIITYEKWRNFLLLYPNEATLENIYWYWERVYLVDMVNRCGCPFQLGNGYKADDPSVAQEIKVPVKIGDAIVTGSDGLFDNVHDYELEKLVCDGLVDLLKLGVISKMLAWRMQKNHCRIQKMKGLIHLLLESAPKPANFISVASMMIF